MSARGFGFGAVGACAPSLTLHQAAPPKPRPAPIRTAAGAWGGQSKAQISGARGLPPPGPCENQFPGQRWKRRKKQHQQGLESLRGKPHERERKGKGKPSMGMHSARAPRGCQGPNQPAPPLTHRLRYPSQATLQPHLRPHAHSRAQSHLDIISQLPANAHTRRAPSKF